LDSITAQYQDGGKANGAKMEPFLEEERDLKETVSTK
jgi:hypothetical protein